MRFIILLGWFYSFDLFSSPMAKGIDTLHFYSASLQKTMPVLVIGPVEADTSEVGRPVLYLLHGHGGYYGSWLELIPELQSWAERLKIWIVCPDGSPESWYLDLDVKRKFRYSSYLSNDLMPYIESHYPVSKEREKRAISGISMGGHGALLLALHRPELFGMVGSSSGVLDLLAFSKEWNLKELLGDPLKYKSQWEQQSCYQLLRNSNIDNTALWIDCGESDFLIDVNRRVHQDLLERKIPHVYMELPGGHDEPYWKEAFRHQMQFIENYFEKG